jgi:hypothetical protein
MKRKEIKLIVENCRSFINNTTEFDKKNKSVLLNSILIENSLQNTFFSGTFESALNEVKLGNMSSEVLLEQVVSDFNNEMILNESTWDTIKDFASSGAKKMSDSVKSAFEKINQMYEDVTLKVWNIITTGKVKAEHVKKSIDSILSKLGDLQKSNPIMFKTMVYVSMILVVSTAIVLTTKQASAQITGVKTLQSDAAMGLLKGLFKKLDAFDFQAHEDLFKQIKELKEAVSSSKKIDPEQLSEFLQSVLKRADAIILSAKEQGKGGIDYEWLKELIKAAKAKITLNNQSI